MTKILLLLYSPIPTHKCTHTHTHTHTLYSPFSYKPWDIRSIDVRYPLYSTRQYLSVRGVFLPQLIEQLKQDGRTFFIDDPHGTLWALLDRATVEAERVHYVLMRTYAPDVINKIAVTSEDVEGTESAEDLSIYLEAVLLLLARYHPELHRVTPIYALCGVLNKGVELISRLFRISLPVDERTKDSFIKWMSTTLSILQCRLSGPISRDDWYDFASAGGANALCTILTSHSLGATQSDRLRECDGKKELMILSAQLLQNLVISGSQYAMVSESCFLSRMPYLRRLLKHDINVEHF